MYAEVLSRYTSFAHDFRTAYDGVQQRKTAGSARGTVLLLCDTALFVLGGYGVSVGRYLHP